MISFRARWGVYRLLQLDGSAEELGISVRTMKSGIVISGERPAIERFIKACLAARYYLVAGAERTSRVAIAAAEKALES